MKKEPVGCLENPAFQLEESPSAAADKRPNGYDSSSIETKVSVGVDDGGGGGGGDSSSERPQWSNGLEFIMSCIAMSVGLGNIWRFPFTAYANGGGAFLIPYIIVLMVIGRPIYFMEMALGQFSSRGSVHMFQALSPKLKGVGYGQVLACICVATYYCSLMAVTLFYFINSFTSNLPWTECRSEWTAALDAKNITCIPSKATNHNGTENTMSSSELYLTNEVLKEADSIEHGLGLPEWRLTLCLLAAWCCTFLVSHRGVQSSGKASYFLALFPYVVMIAILIRAVTLEGAVEGIVYFIRPQWSKLLDANVWYAAVTQCFFSLNVGFGAIVMYSSYNSFEHNINRDAMVVTTMDTFTSILAGATIFGILGNLAHQLGTDMTHVVNSGGGGLAFISYPEAIAKFDTVPWLFALLFFGMLFVLGIGSLVALHGCVITVLSDSFPKLIKWHVSLGTALLGFLAGLVYVTPGGQFILTLVDHFGGTFIIFILCIIEVCAVTWWYGVDNFCNDIEFMTGKRVGTYWRVCWAIITPVSLILIFIYFLVTLKRLTYSGHEYPDWVLVFGWSILGLSMLIVLYYMVKAKFTYTPAEYEWAPINPQKKAEYLQYKKARETVQPAGMRQRILRYLTGKDF